MADMQIGTMDNTFPMVNVGTGPNNPTNLNGANTNAQTGFTGTNYATIAAMRARLAAIQPGYYTAAVLNTMTVNDCQYALRVYDNPSTIKQ